MSTATWTLTDTTEGVDLTDWSVRAEHVAGTPGGWSVSKRRLSGGKQDGVSVVEIDNGRMKIFVVPTRGMSVQRCVTDDDVLGWKSPVAGPVHPVFVPILDPSGLGWLEGFDELLVRCGLQSNGAPVFDERHVLQYPLHGRIANLPAHRVAVTIDADAGTISVTGVVAEVRFLFHHLELVSTITTSFGSTEFRVDDRIVNRSAQPSGIQLLYHFNVGLPLLDAGSKLVAPVKRVVPRNSQDAEGICGWDEYAAPQPGFAEQVYFLDLIADPTGQTQVLLKNAAESSGVSLSFNQSQLPCFTQWKNTATEADGYVTGLEPATNFPNPRDFEQGQGRVVQLGPRESYETSLTVRWLLDAHAVRTAESAVRELQAGAEPQLLDSPQPGWCAGEA